jgi:uncharacterized protein (DUF362 family)
MRLSRRDFIRSGIILTGGALLPAWAAADRRHESYPDVSHVTGGDTEEKVAAAIDALGGITRFVKPGQTVVINPNVGFPNPVEMATTTDPEAVAAVAGICRSAGAKRVVVADYPVQDPEYCFERSGMAKLARLNGVGVIPLSSESAYRTMPVPGYTEVPEVDLAEVAADAAVLIAMPVAKCHSSAGVSLAMKGNMGLIRARGPFHSRYDLHQAVVDLAKLVTPTLVVTDAQRALITRGPGGPGEVARPDAIIAGVNSASVDAYTVGAVKWYHRRVAPEEIRHIRLAGEQGVGEIDVARLRVSRLIT